MYDSCIVHYRPLLTQLTYFLCKSYSQVFAVLVLNRCAWRHKGLPQGGGPHRAMCAAWWTRVSARANHSALHIYRHEPATRTTEL